ncbi:glutamyl-tRNA reductase [[Haemophilus] felis]|nr:glutamyl-tRNA reductase [[Haemophilus] felis]
MTILVLGVNHKTAPVALREKVAFSQSKQHIALQQIQARLLADSAVILSTCNRTEIYLHNKSIAPAQAENWIADCQQWLAEIHQLPLDSLKPNLYIYQNQSAVIHLMKVACGLDSLILGEPQIFGQVKQAYQQSEMFYKTYGGLSTELSRLFQKTFASAKRVRTETLIGENAVSVAYAACSVARQVFDSLQNLTVLLVGAGETIELVCRHLVRHGIKKIFLANRTLSRAENLIAKLETQDNIQLLKLSELQFGLNQANIVISSTASEQVLINHQMVQQAQEGRNNLPLLLVDIAVPRDIDENVKEIEGVHHYTVDDLQNIIQCNLTGREKASQQALQIIQQKSDDFFEWLKVHQFSNLIRRYRQQADNIRQELVDKALISLAQGESAEQLLQELSYKLTNKLIHSPTRVMSHLVKTGNANGLAIFSDSINDEEIHQQVQSS